MSLSQITLGANRNHCDWLDDRLNHPFCACEVLRKGCYLVFPYCPFDDDLACQC